MSLNETSVNSIIESRRFWGLRYRPIGQAIGRCAKIVVNENGEQHALQAVRQAAEHADVLVKASGVGVFDSLLEHAVIEYARPRTQTVFWDVDAPATLASSLEVGIDPAFRNTGRRDPFRATAFRARGAVLPDKRNAPHTHSDRGFATFTSMARICPSSSVTTASNSSGLANREKKEGKRMIG